MDSFDCEQCQESNTASCVISVLRANPFYSSGMTTFISHRINLCLTLIQAMDSDFSAAVCKAQLCYCIRLCQVTRFCILLNFILGHKTPSFQTCFELELELFKSCFVSFLPFECTYYYNSFNVISLSFVIRRWNNVKRNSCAKKPSELRVTLFIGPAVLFTEGRTYVLLK